LVHLAEVGNPDHRSQDLGLLPGVVLGRQGKQLIHRGLLPGRTNPQHGIPLYAVPTHLHTQYLL